MRWFGRRPTFETHFRPSAWELRTIDRELEGRGVPLPPMSAVAWFAVTATGVLVAALVARLMRSALQSG